MAGIGASEESSCKSGFLSFCQTSSCKQKSEEENIFAQNNVRLSLTTAIVPLWKHIYEAWTFVYQYLLEEAAG